MMSTHHSRQVAHPTLGREVFASVHDFNSSAKQFHLATLMSLRRFYA